ncbi:NAD(P)H-binding protein [Flavihumibacter petaseus]|uniref:Putative oxidoreductase n=1 Tax=Flavihumibacter petaseus NBRC 106054 TaxID=1220578 RepID=A0A0E9N3Z5_9BACT|nr:NAD(P)H-binding protein [Flavihumibacter petaseus]GAO44508.1 putative oxidoreductase [Flavihumibacter petaseus NBRC 106054]
MNIVLTGSLGNTGRPLAVSLVKQGHKVTVISSDPSRKAAIEQVGATAAIGSLDDVTFLTTAFRGADAVYTMIPPNVMSNSYRLHMEHIAACITRALRAAGVKRVVNLSSIGAELPSGTGPIAGLHVAEALLDTLEGVNVTNLRAGFFYLNFLGNLGMIRESGIIGSNYAAENRLPMVHPSDIAAAAAEELTDLNSNHHVRYVVSDERTLGEVAAVLGKAIGKPELPWVAFTDDAALEGLRGAGLPDEAARLFVEMGQAVRNGSLLPGYEQHRPEQPGKVKLEEFANEFAAAYSAG